jgi:myosin heavy subunit
MMFKGSNGINATVGVCEKFQEEIKSPLLIFLYIGNICVPEYSLHNQERRGSLCLLDLSKSGFD